MIQPSQSGVYSLQTTKCGRVEDGGVLFRFSAGRRALFL